MLTAAKIFVCRAIDMNDQFADWALIYVYRSQTQDEISWIGEAEVLTRYHLTPNCSLRAGLEFMVIDSLALAPRQINFLNVSNWIETGGNPWYMGGLFGFECYW